jgi:hypothetical protein
MKKQIHLNSFTQVNLPILLIILTSLLISAFLTNIYIALEVGVKPLFVFYLTSFALVFIFFLNCYACYHIKICTESQEKSRKQEIENQIINRTLTFIERWNAPDYFPFKRIANNLYQSFEKQPIEQQSIFIIKHLEDNPKERDDITTLLNFLEEMSICVEEKIVKEELLIKFFKGIVISYCKVYSPYIQDRREKRANPNLYKPLTNLWEKWSTI